jgi:hypothetical protein
VARGRGIFHGMRADRWTGLTRLTLLTLLALTTRAGSARADGKPGTLAERVEDCEGLPEDGKIRYEAIGKLAVYGAAPSGERYLVFPEHEGRDCAVYALARPAAQLSGSFGAGSEVVALRPPRCGGGSCAIALAVRGKDGRPVAALHTRTSCDDSVALQPIKLFPGRDSVELVCHTSAGAGWKERRVLLDAGSGAIAELYGLDTGGYIALSPDEKARPGACPSRPVGSLRVEKAGERPLLRVIDPASGALTDGKGTLPARQLGYDPKRRAFAPTGAPDVPTKVDARAGCAAP